MEVEQQQQQQQQQQQRVSKLFPTLFHPKYLLLTFTWPLTRIFRWMGELRFNGLCEPLNATLALLTVRPATWQKCHRDEADLGGAQGEGVEPWGTLRIPAGKTGEP